MLAGRLRSAPVHPETHAHIMRRVQRYIEEEVAKALLTGIRRERWSGAAADSACRRLRTLAIRLIDDDRGREHAWDLSRRFDNHPIDDLL